MPRPRDLLPILALLASVLVWRPGWLPGDPETGMEFAPVWAPTQGPGLLVAVDPATRQLVAPKPEQIRAWSQGALRAPRGALRIERLPRGGEIVRLNGAFRSYVIARRDSRGKIVTECVPGN